MDVEGLYRSYRDDVFRYLVHLTHDPGQAEDLLSETFLQALQALPDFRGASSVKTWLFGIARHCFLHSLRRRLPQVCEEDLTLLACADDWEERLFRQDTLRRVRSLLAGMEPRARQVLTLFAEGYRYEEIGAALSLSPGSARVIVFRARKKLKELLETEDWNL